ncbi:hypothetical protein CONPUDRAFT_151555 [Coniophora puteana RWD-64-598 SS2]|uniref:Protein-S-isoprenylcysteine O-methyltransferase n=1 Tax=Coniophora puteana (strain RWD-64-598) TaxID=741705 RepID=A0A5M3MZI1_CONPW|nr:uncharacterized protein CONPUDRAFT_151555 [Coniophora puteana RWD-64-598 SS2]EIW84539.1 hypothetical protein CONPUDRAFT_151555 [Coniophora puteana RWD-64-598 SS2]
MALVKSILLISSSLSVEACLTPPGVSKKGERIPYTSFNLDLLELVAERVAPFITRALIVVVAVAEAVTIIASEHPHLFPSGRVSTLNRGAALPSAIPNALFITGALLALAGSQLRLLCFRTLGKHFVFNVALKKNHRLITSGPYSIVRHPSC